MSVWMFYLVSRYPVRSFDQTKRLILPFYKSITSNLPVPSIIFTLLKLVLSPITLIDRSCCYISLSRRFRSTEYMHAEQYST
jgi:hypothetical protein